MVALTESFKRELCRSISKMRRRPSLSLSLVLPRSVVHDRNIVSPFEACGGRKECYGPPYALGPLGPTHLGHTD
eukprot:5152705-Prymnesium_polylepis.1